ncbi:hypothetical protein ACFYNM_37655 [Streptomyces spororaveus]|uniref:hypothetical protein n=1 Tax=Streptomyces spororaveus TaxID=284039 RepID=UPI0036CE2734
MANEPVNTPIQTAYTDHLAAALAANQAEQASLSTRLNKLQGEEKWLAAALADTPEAVGRELSPPEVAQPVASALPVGEDAPAVPLPRAEEAGEAPAAKATTAKKTAAKKSAAAKKPPVKQGAAGGAKQAAKAEPTLGKLLIAILSKQPGEPKKVSEIQAELDAAHPDRVTTVQTVRNALERLTKTDGLEKDTRQGMVLYTWPEAAPAPAEEAKAKEAEPAAV